MRRDSVARNGVIDAIDDSRAHIKRPQLSDPHLNEYMHIYMLCYALLQQCGNDIYMYMNDIYLYIYMYIYIYRVLSMLCMRNFAHNERERESAREREREIFFVCVCRESAREVSSRTLPKLLFLSLFLV